MRPLLGGLSAWWLQRLSALYIGGYLLLVLLVWMRSSPLDYEGWLHLWSYLPVTIATQLFFLALLLHAWVGVRDVILDYAGHFPLLRWVLLSLLGGWLLGLGLWAVRITLRGAPL